jgi:hypothetical protein
MLTALEQAYGHPVDERGKVRINRFVGVFAPWREILNSISLAKTRRRKELSPIYRKRPERDEDRGEQSVPNISSERNDNPIWQNPNIPKSAPKKITEFPYCFCTPRRKNRHGVIASVLV